MTGLNMHLFKQFFIFLLVILLVMIETIKLGLDMQIGLLLSLPVTIATSFFFPNSLKNQLLFWQI